MSEAALRRITKNAERMTIRDVLRLPLNPRLLTCAVMHEDIVPAGVIRSIAAAIGAVAIDRAAAEGTYLDFRTRRAIDAARTFGAGRSSAGELHVACAHAEAARDLVMDLGDPTVTKVAALAVSVCDPDSRSAVLRTLADALELFPSTDGEQRYLDLISTMLQEVA